MTYYSDRNSVHIAQHNANSNRSKHSAVPAGYVLLYKNMNYSNTTLPCVVLCKREDVQWYGKTKHNH